MPVLRGLDEGFEGEDLEGKKAVVMDGRAWGGRWSEWTVGQFNWMEEGDCLGPTGALVWSGINMKVRWYRQRKDGRSQGEKASERRKVRIPLEGSKVKGRI